MTRTATLYISTLIPERRYNIAIATKNNQDLLEGIERCPRCGKGLERGWIYNSGFYTHGMLFWYKEKRWFGKFERLLYPRFLGRWIAARRCRNCSLVLFRSENPTAKEVRRYMLKFILIFLLIVILILVIFLGIPMLRWWIRYGADYLSLA